MDTWRPPTRVPPTAAGGARCTSSSSTATSAPLLLHQCTSSSSAGTTAVQAPLDSPESAVVEVLQEVGWDRVASLSEVPDMQSRHVVSCVEDFRVMCRKLSWSVSA